MELLRRIGLLLLVTQVALTAGYSRHVGRGKYLNSTLRPQLHYTPVQNWLNDPNGLVRGTDGVWHLYYQCE